MKKFLFCFICLSLLSCTCPNQQHNNTNNTNVTSNVKYLQRDSFGSMKIQTVIIDGHEYIVSIYDGYQCGGISTIHSEHCSCKYNY